MSDNLLPEQISEGHCYQLRADNGVRVSAKVHEITERARNPDRPYPRSQREVLLAKG
jgi:hypothetical protein